MPQIQPIAGNPLKKHFRQPKIYLKLPSGGKYWPDGTLQLNETGEIPVYAMTAKDELMLKTPDALLNGEGTVQVMQSCIPNILNGWYAPSIDIDAILVAIRIATYGESLDVRTVTPVTNESKDYSLNLTSLLGQFSNVVFEDTVSLGEITFKIRPLNYKEFTETSNKTFEEQRIFYAINNENIPEAEKIKIFRESFQKLTELTVDTLKQSVVSVTIDNDVVTNKQFIDEFLDNSEKNIFNAITGHVEKQREKFKIQPMLVDATEEEIAQGVPATYTVPITLDAASFFA